MRSHDHLHNNTRQTRLSWLCGHTLAAARRLGQEGSYTPCLTTRGRCSIHVAHARPRRARCGWRIACPSSRSPPEKSASPTHENNNKKTPPIKFHECVIVMHCMHGCAHDHTRTSITSNAGPSASRTARVTFCDTPRDSVASGNASTLVMAPHLQRIRWHGQQLHTPIGSGTFESMALRAPPRARATAACAPQRHVLLQRSCDDEGLAESSGTMTEKNVPATTYRPTVLGLSLACLVV